MVAVCLAAGIVHFAVWSATTSATGRIIVDSILIAVIATAIVTRFRGLLRAGEEEAKPNPKLW